MEKSEILEQRIIIKFMWKLGKGKQEIMCDLSLVYGESALKQRTVEKWLQLFRQGRESTEDDPRSGRPSTSTSSDCVEAVKTLIDNNRKVTTREVAETLDISIGSVVEILHDHLGMSKISSRWVPRLLTKEMKAARRDLSLVFMNKFDQGPENFLQRIITGDETWLYLHDPESKQASMEWRFKGERAPTKPKMVRSAGKVMVTVFFDAQGVILLDYLEQGKTVTGARYDDALTSLREAIKDKRRGKLAKGIIFHHDNAPAHTSNRIQDSLRRHGFEILPHPAYSPDLAPCDFHLFPKIKRSMKGRRFGSLDEVKSAFETLLEEQEPSFFRSAFWDWRRRAEKCYETFGDYVEK